MVSRKSPCGSASAWQPLWPPTSSATRTCSRPGRCPAGGAPANAPANTGAPGTYTVQGGDSPWRIANRFGVTLNAFLAANGFTANVILRPGQVVNIPGGGTAPAAPGARPASTTPGLNHLGTEKVVIADYVMWYDPALFDGSKTWDVPADGTYNSGDCGTLQQHVTQAQQACLNGLAAHWCGPGESWTTGNFNQLLAASAGTGLRHAVVIQANVLPGASEQSIIEAVRYALDNWAYGPNYLRLGGRC